MKAPSSAAVRSAPLGASPGQLHILLVDPVFRSADQPGPTRSLDIAQRFAQAGHRVSVLTTAAAAKTVTHEGVDVTAMETRVRARFGYAPAPELAGSFARGLLGRIWRIKDVDVVLATDRPIAALPVLMWFCFLRGIPLLLDARDGPPSRAAPSLPFGQRVKAWAARCLYRLGAGFARRIAVMSPDMESAFGGGALTVAGPGCDTVLFAAAPGASAPALTAYPHLAQGLLVVYAGAMDGARNLAPLLDLAAAVQNQNTGIAFALCGAGPLRGMLEARALELGVLNKTVWFLDALPRKDLAPLLGAATAVMVDNGSATRSEEIAAGLFFDALAAGRPVIISASGWQRDLIDGRGAGLGLPAGGGEAAARELVDFLKDSDGIRRASQQAHALAAGRFNIERIASKMRGLVEESVAADPRHAVIRRRTLRAKRMIDIAVSLGALIVLSPLLMATAIAVRIKMGGPVLFTQARPGLKGRPFQIYKFRTMTTTKGADGALLPDGVRLTPFGQFLRRMSIDELPQLFNVLKGDMSLIGPRPLLPEYMPYYTSEQHRRHDVLPGISGWAQVHGRNAVTWEEKFAMDVWYVDHLSLGLDFLIAWKTLLILVSGKGVSSEGHATFERFDEIMARRQGAEDV